jgi:voltage-gated potassium channel
MPRRILDSAVWQNRPRLSTAQRFVLAAAFPLVLVVLGTAGYTTVEGWPVFDSLFMTVITLTTIGYGEVHPLTTAGRVFTMGLALGGTVSMFFVVSEILRAVVGGEIQQYFGRQRMERALAAMSNHVIVCGLGRMGRRVCTELAGHSVPFVVIEQQEEPLRDVPRDWMVLRGDATSEEVLGRAGLSRARALVSAVASDSDNLFITMTARLLNDKVLIVARAENEASETKLTRAGANRVVAPYVLGGHRVAQALLRPSVLEFIDLATRTSHMELQIEETAILPRSQLAGRTPESARIADELRLLLVAVRKPSGEMLFNPPPSTPLAEGDTLIAIGSQGNLDRLRALASAATPAP